MNPSTDSGGDSKSPNSDSRGVKLWQWALKSPGSQAGVAETWYFQILRTHDCHAEFKIIQKCNIKPLSNFLIWENRFQSHLKNRGQRGSRQNFLRPDLHIELCNSLIAALPAGDFCFLWGKIRAWNDSYQCYHCTRSGTAFCFRRCTKLLLETHTFFFLNCAISLFLAALWTNSRVVLVILMSQESGKRLAFECFPAVENFQPILGSEGQVFGWFLLDSVTLYTCTEILNLFDILGMLLWIRTGWRFFSWNNPFKCGSIKPFW